MSDEHAQAERTVTLSSDSLLSKWGFGDGDMLDDLLFDWERETGRSVDRHAVLVRLVREHLIPALDQQVEVDLLHTIHNPIRAFTVDGREVGDDHYRLPPRTVLTPERVVVPESVVLAVALEESVALQDPEPEEAPRG